MSFYIVIYKVSSTSFKSWQLKCKIRLSIRIINRLIYNYYQQTKYSNFYFKRRSQNVNFHWKRYRESVKSDVCYIWEQLSGVGDVATTLKFAWLSHVTSPHNEEDPFRMILTIRVETQLVISKIIFGPR